MPDMGTCPVEIGCKATTACVIHTRLGQISNNVPGKNPVGIFEEKGANNFF